MAAKKFPTSADPVPAAPLHQLTHSHFCRQSQAKPIPPGPSRLPPPLQSLRQQIRDSMKLLTLNFLTCARKACKSSPAAFPLHPRDAELEVVETDPNPLFIRNILPRLEWDALRTLASEV